MGSVIKLSKKINNSYIELKKSVEDKLDMVDEKLSKNFKAMLIWLKKCLRITLTLEEKIKSINHFRSFKIMWL